MDDVKAKVAEDAKQLDSLEDTRKRLTREREDVVIKNEELQAQVEKLDKSRKKLQGEVCVFLCHKSRAFADFEAKNTEISESVERCSFLRSKLEGNEMVERSYREWQSVRFSL